MSNAVEKVRQRLLRATRVLDEAGVPYAVIGGNAVAVWVARVDESAVRNTQDVDLLLARSDLAKAEAALSAAGFRHREVAFISKPGSMHVFLDGDGSRIRDAVHVIFAGEKVAAGDLLPSAEVAEVELMGNLWVLTLEALVRMKLISFRDKDRTHLRDLIEVGLVSASWLPRLPEVLHPRLQQILDTPEG